MAINVARYRYQGKVSWGIVNENGIVPIPGEYPTTGEFLLHCGGHANLRREGHQRDVVPRKDVELLSPITANQQVICQGVNYRDHMREVGMDPDAPGANPIFRKASSCLCAADAAIIKPAHVKLLDYEAELGLVIGRDIRGPQDVGEENLHDYVAALTIHNDISARDIQLTQPTGQFYKGKSYRTFGPTGPYLTLVNREDLRRFDDLHLRLSVDGEVRQDAYCGSMVYKPSATIYELSRVQDLRAGDLIATGTPGGVALQAPRSRLLMMLVKFMSEKKKWRMFIDKNVNNPRYLRDRQLIETWIGTDDEKINLGVQRNQVIFG